MTDDILIAGSTNPLVYYPMAEGVGVQPTSMSAKLFDAMGAEVTTTSPQPEWDTAEQRIVWVLAPEDVPAERVHNWGELWKVVWTWEYAGEVRRHAVYHSVLESELPIDAPPVTAENCMVTEAEVDDFLNTTTRWREWSAVPRADRVRAILTASRVIDGIPFHGIKALVGQAHAFPRAYGQDAPIEYGSPWNGIHGRQPFPNVDSGVPDGVKRAIAQEALVRATVGDERTRLQQQGVTSISMLGVSESYSGPNKYGLLSPDAERELKPWLLGSVMMG